tara:strand:+ start:876 stop:1253 length:378 start_codon:yes stop_codon:yes gene_type:complete
MKIILIDAWNTLVKNKKLDVDLYYLLEKFENRKIILTNANNNELIDYGIVEMPYDVFSLSHEPNKDDSLYFKLLIKKYNLINTNLIYIEHNYEAVQSAMSIGIKTHHYNPKDTNDSVYQFLLKNI